MGRAADDRGCHHHRHRSDLPVAHQRAHPVPVGVGEAAVPGRQLGAGRRVPVDVAAHVEKPRPVRVRLRPRDLVGKHPADGSSHRPGLASEQVPQSRLKRGERLDVQRIGDRLLARKMVKQRTVRDLAALPDPRDRRLVIPKLDEAGQRAVENPGPDRGGGHFARPEYHSGVMLSGVLVLRFGDLGQAARDRPEEVRDPTHGRGRPVIRSLEHAGGLLVPLEGIADREHRVVRVAVPGRHVADAGEA